MRAALLRPVADDELELTRLAFARLLRRIDGHWSTGAADGAIDTLVEDERIRAEGWA